LAEIVTNHTSRTSRSFPPPTTAGNADAPPPAAQASAPAGPLLLRAWKVALRAATFPMQRGERVGYEQRYSCCTGDGAQSRGYSSTQRVQAAVSRRATLVFDYVSLLEPPEGSRAVPSEQMDRLEREHRPEILKVHASTRSHLRARMCTRSRCSAQFCSISSDAAEMLGLCLRAHQRSWCMRLCACV
jgi:hypothetical protein